METRKWLVLVFFLAIQGSYAQDYSSPGTVHGRVSDAQGQELLQGAHVFLANTQIGTITNDQGQFSLMVPPGRHDLVVSMIGFLPETQKIFVEAGADYALEVILEPRVYEGPEVVVTGEHPRTWRKHLKLFVRHFLGTSSNASQCKILNPLVLDFEVKETPEQLYATASEPLVIENQALGYRITWILEEFVLDVESRQIRYAGQPFFKEMIPRNERQRRRWDERREAAYVGSLRHFLASLAQGPVDADGFRTEIAPYLPINELAEQAMRLVDPRTLIQQAAMPYERQLYFVGYLEVRFEGEREEKAYLDFVGARPTPKAYQTSYLTLHRTALLHERGYFNDAYDATVYGYWGWERVGDLLPRDYDSPVQQR